MTSPRARPDARARAASACVAGVGASFVIAVWLIRWVRPALLVDPEPAWALARLLLGLTLAAASAAAGVLVAAALLHWSGTPGCPTAIESLPLSSRALVSLSLAAFLFGTLLRLVWLQRVPESLWIDDVSLIGPARSLSGGWSDFADSIRPVPFGAPDPPGTVGVAYLELCRLSLRLWGVTVFGLRFPSFAAGVLSLLTAGLLARRLLPRGGGTMAILALAGMRWSLIMSRWAWVAIAIAPLLDLAAVGVLNARRRDRRGWALTAGATAGLTAHLYLAGWIGTAALALWSLWPCEDGRPFRRRARMALLFLLGFAAVAAPLFLLRSERRVPYFTRALHGNLITEIRHSRSALPPFAAAADAIAAPWLLGDPLPRHDLPDRSRLGWILGVPVAVVLCWALVHPVRELSAFLLSQAAAALAATIAGGNAHLPNGFRFAYLSTVAAVAVAGGVGILLCAVPESRRRVAGMGAIGLLALSSFLGAREAILDWAERRETYDAFLGEETSIGRAAARWDRYGEVRMGSGLAARPLAWITISAVRRYRLDPQLAGGEIPMPPPGHRSRSFRIVRPGQLPGPRERLVERVRDGWGREHAVVYGGESPPP